MAGAAPRHTVKIYNRAAGQEVEVEVPEDRCAAVAWNPDSFPQFWNHVTERQSQDATRQSRYRAVAQ